MASKMDVYAPCPCGSGKKVKFCCQSALGEMDRVARMHENRQSDKALETLEGLAARHPTAPIIPITRSQLLMEERRFDEAASVMKAFLTDNPDSANGLALYAFARFMDVGFHEAKPDIHRAFQVCAQSSPEIVASLAAQIAEGMLPISGISAREHLALALRLSRDPEDRQSMISRMMQIDGAREIPYPIRGPHQLEPLTAPEGHEKTLRNAVRLSMLGCWEISAKLFLQLSEHLPESWALWKNIGLCHAWDANHDASAEALHKAADLCDQRDDAVECETVAQLLELERVEEQTDIVASRYSLKATSRTLTTLDAHDRFHRLPDSSDQQAGVTVSARYLMLDMPAPDDSEPVTDDNVPTALAEISVFEFAGQDGKSVGALTLMAPEGDDREQAVKLLEETIRDEVDSPEDAEDDALGTKSAVRSVLSELLPAQSRKFYGKRLTVLQRRERAVAEARRFLDDIWSATPLKRLQGKTPKEASSDPALAVRLAAAVNVLESVVDPATTPGDFDALRSSLGIGSPQAFAVEEDNPLNSISVMQLYRLPLGALSDEQLSHIVNRALMIGHLPHVYAVLTEVARRGVDKVAGLDEDAFLRAISQTCRDLGRRDEAYEWIQKGREKAEQADSFEERLNWEMRELSFRIEDRDDPKLPVLVEHIWNYYGQKLPEIRDNLRPLLEELDMPVPGESKSGIILPGASSAEAAATASASEDAGDGGSKLWLPGQD